MAVQPRHDPDFVDIDYDVYDLDELNRQPASYRPRRGAATSSRPHLGDPRVFVPLGLLLAALFLIYLAVRASGDDELANVADGSDLIERVQSAQLRAGFDGLTITEADGTIIIEGSAGDPTIAASIGAVARSVEGTQRVDNRVVVQGGAVDTTPATVAPSADLSQRLSEVGNVTFETGSVAITAEGNVVVDSVAALLAQNPGTRIEVHGHTDSDGDETQNQVLSQQRADAVVSALVGRGIDPSLLSGIGFGESNPIGPNLTEEGRAINRRIEFIVAG